MTGKTYENVLAMIKGALIDHSGLIQPFPDVEAIAQAIVIAVEDIHDREKSYKKSWLYRLWSVFNKR